jgi:hypothetical protein
MAATSSIPDRLHRTAFPADAPDFRRIRRPEPVRPESMRFGHEDEDADDADDAWALDIPASRPVRRTRPARRKAPWLRIGLMSAAVIASLAYLAQKRDRQENEPVALAVPQASLIAPPPEWQPIARPAPIYVVEGPDGRGLPSTVDARRHANGGREDTLTFGDFGDAGYARLSIARGPAERDSGRFYVDLVRRAAGSGLSVVRSGQSEAVTTKFGTVEAAPVTLVETAEQGCIAFRFAHGELSFGFEGWLCGSQTIPVTTGQLACFIDRLALTGSADDQPMRLLFAQSDRNRLEECAPLPRTAAGKPVPNRS